MPLQTSLSFKSCNSLFVYKVAMVFEVNVKISKQAYLTRKFRRCVQNVHTSVTLTFFQPIALHEVLSAAGS